MRKRDLASLDLEALEEALDPRFGGEPATASVRRGPVRTRSRGRLTEQARARLAEQRRTGPDEPPPGGQGRWSSWDDAEQRGPRPYPGWLVTELDATDQDLGVLKTGKEADVFLVERALNHPDSGRSCLLAAKRYRDGDHRLFHRDASYLEGRRVRESRQMRAMQRRSGFGRNLIAEQWAVAEFAALSQLWSAGAPVPYPVQRIGTELLLEFIGDPDGVAAPRLVQLRPSPDQLADVWQQLTGATLLLARHGRTHGDLSAYNLLVHHGTLVMIDLPQLVDLHANPQGPTFLRRDVQAVCTWFRSRGLPGDLADPGSLTELLLDEAARRGG